MLPKFHLGPFQTDPNELMSQTLCNQVEALHLGKIGTLWSEQGTKYSNSGGLRIYWSPQLSPGMPLAKLAYVSLK